jgi:two-component system nitrogen regulation sensor histidine kinase GlnL
MNSLKKFDDVPLAFFSIKKDGRIVSANFQAELLMDDMSGFGIRKFGEFFLDKINRNNLIFKTPRGTYGIKVLRARTDYDFFVIALDEFNQPLEDLMDISSLQHEIKNPLTVIDGTAQLIAAKAKNEYIEKCANIIQQESKRIKSILGNIHMLSEMTVKFEDFSIDGFINELYDVIKILYPDIELRFHLLRNLRVIRADREKLFMALSNIIKNACEAQGEGDIEIGFTIDPTIKYFDKENNKTCAMLRIVVSDSGPGITEQVQEKLFTPFFTTKNKGTGLGLIITKEVIDKHHGRIEVNSVRGKGTDFIVYVPSRVSLEKED